MLRHLTALSLAGSLAFFVPAQATTYVATRTIGAATATLDITTDDTLGALTSANVIAWDIVLSDGTNFAELTDANSIFSMGGEGFLATSTDLLFDFDSPDHGLSFHNGTAAYCLSAPPVNCERLPFEAALFGPTGPDYARALSGTQVIASVAAAVPEPLTWTTMILGLGLVGMHMRRRQGSACRLRIIHA